MEGNSSWLPYSAIGDLNVAFVEYVLHLNQMFKKVIKVSL